MPFKDIGQSQVAPHLAEAWIDIQENSPRRSSQNLFVLQEPHHINQQRSVTRTLEHIRPGEADESFTTVVEQCKGVFEPKSSYDFEKVLQIH